MKHITHPRYDDVNVIDCLVIVYLILGSIRRPISLERRFRIYKKNLLVK